MSKTIFLTGSSGFIGNALIKHFHDKDYFVIGADIELPKYNKADAFYNYDLRNQDLTERIFKNHTKIDEVWNLACLMGGMGIIGDDKHAFDIMVGSTQIVTNIIDLSVKYGVNKHFYSGSACCYNMDKQMDENIVIPLKEEDSMPIKCDLIYGYQKNFSELLYQSAAISKGLDIRLARFFNIFGIEGVYDGGKEKAPASLTRKVCKSKNGEEIEVWGSGNQQRTFLHIDELLIGLDKLIESDYTSPINFGSSELIRINDLAQMVIDISGKDVKIKNIEGNVGVASRTPNNELCQKVLNWSPNRPLREGMEKLYAWVNEQVNHGMQENSI